MIINELAYKVTIKADEFLNGKKKVEEGVKELGDAVDAEWESIGKSTEKTGNEVVKAGDKIQRSAKKTGKDLKDTSFDIKKFGNEAASSFRGAYVAAAGFLGIGAGLYGIKQLFTSTADAIVLASTQAKFFGSDVNKMFGVRRGFQQAGLNGDAFIGASGNARMALANIKDPTIFGGLTGAAQNLLTIGARTGININQLGDPNKALPELTRYGKGHSQENLMQVMAALGFDPTDAAKIKSGELKSLVDSETKKSNITAEQVKKQEDLVVKMGELGAQVDRVAQGLVAAFTPDVIAGMEAFGKWIDTHQGDIIGFFNSAGDTVKKFTDAVGGANALLLLLAFGLKRNPLVMGATALIAIDEASKKRAAEAKAAGVNAGDVLNFNKPNAFPGNIYTEGMPDPVKNAQVSSDRFWGWISGLFSSEPEQHAQSARRKGNLPNRNNNPGNLRPPGANSGFQSFSSELEGWNAMSRQLMMYFNGTSAAAGFKKLRTVSDIIGKWAPASENDTASYVKEVAAYMGVGANQELNLNDQSVMAKLRTAMARREGFSNWKNGLNTGVSSQTQDNYYLQQQKLANAAPINNQRVDNSQSSSTHIGQVVVNSNPQSFDALTESIKRQSSRASTNASFSSGVHG